MQEFIDKFRFNAKRASLVQSRIKSMAKEVIIEDVAQDAVFKFAFPDAGQLGTYSAVQYSTVCSGVV